MGQKTEQQKGIGHLDNPFLAYYRCFVCPKFMHSAERRTDL